MPWVDAPEENEKNTGRWVDAGGEEDPRNAIREMMNKTNLPGQELKSAPEDVNVLSRYTNAIENAIKRMFNDPEKEKARNANIVAMAQKHKLPINLVDGYFNTLKESEFESTDVNMQKIMKGVGVYGGAAAIPLIAHGLWAAPLLTLGGLAFAEGANEAVSMVNHVRKGKWSEYRPLKGAASVEDTEYGKDMANLISLVGGLAAGGIGGAKFIPRGKNIPELSSLITKRIIHEGGIPKKVWLDGEQVAEIISGRPNVVFKGGEKGSNWIPEEVIEFYKECGLNGNEARQAIKFGLDIEVSTDKIIKMVDRPYWDKLKKIMKMDPYQRVIGTEKGGRVTYKIGNEDGVVTRPERGATVAGELAETIGETEKVTPVGREAEGATDIAPQPVENVGGQMGAKRQKSPRLTLAIRDGDRVFVAEKERIHGDLLARLVEDGKIEGEHAWLDLANSKSAMGWVDEEGNYYGKDEAVRLMNGEAKIDKQIEETNNEIEDKPYNIVQFMEHANKMNPIVGELQGQYAPVTIGSGKGTVEAVLNNELHKSMTPFNIGNMTILKDKGGNIGAVVVSSFSGKWAKPIKEAGIPIIRHNGRRDAAKKIAKWQAENINSEIVEPLASKKVTIKSKQYFVELRTVYDAEGKVIGEYILHPSSPKIADFSSLEVYDPWKGKGLSHKIVDMAIEQAKNEGFESITLKPDPNKGSEYEDFLIKLYEKHGYKITGKSEDGDFTYMGLDLKKNTNVKELLDDGWENWMKESEGLGGKSIESVIEDPNATLGELEDALAEVKGVLDNLGAARKGFDKLIRAKDKADRIQAKADKRGNEIAANRFETQKALAKMRNIRAKIKEIIGGQKVGNVVGEYEALTAAFKKAERHSKIAYSEGNKIGAEKARAKMKEMRAIEKNREWLKKDIKRKISSMKKMATRKGMDADYRELLQSMLADYDLAIRSDRTLGKRMNTREFIEREKELGNVIDIPDKVMDIVYRTPLAEMTIDELWELHDAVIMLGKLGILKSKLIAGAKARNFEKVKWGIIEEVEERMGVPEKEGGPLISERETKKEGMWHKVRQISSEFVKVEYLVEKVDNWEKNGPLHDALIKPMVGGVVKKFQLEHATAERMKPAFNLLKNNWKNILNDKIKVGGIEITKENAIMVALNSGNEGNIRNLMEGNKLTRDQIDKIVASLSTDEMQFVNEIWDIVESFFHKIQKINRDLTGNKIERVDGHYFPIITDAELNTAAKIRMVDEDMFEITMLRAKVKNGMTIRRKPNAVAGPLNLIFDVIFRHINDVINYVSFAVPVRDAQKILLDPEISGTLIKRLGKENYDQMLPWVRDIANPRNPITGGERVLATLKNNAAIAMMGWSLSVSFLQPLAYSQTINRIGWGNAIRSLMDFYAHPIENVKFILDNDTWMYERTRTLDRDIREFMQARDMKGLFTDHTIRDSYFSIMTATDRLATFPTWWAGYQMEMASSGDHELAVEAGRKLVRQTQGSGMTMDTPRSMRRQALKIFTMFQSFFSSTYNENWKDWNRWKDGDINFGKLMLSWWWIYVLPGAVSTILYNYLRKGKVEAGDTISGIAGYAAGSIPVAGSLINSVLEGWEYRPSPIVKLPSEIVKMSKSKTPEQFMEHGVSATGYVAGLPTRQILLTADFVNELTKGNVEPGRLLYRPEKKKKGTGYNYK